MSREFRTLLSKDPLHSAAQLCIDVASIDFCGFAMLIAVPRSNVLLVSLSGNEFSVVLALSATTLGDFGATTEIPFDTTECASIDAPTFFLVDDRDSALWAVLPVVDVAVAETVCTETMLLMPAFDGTGSGMSERSSEPSVSCGCTDV